ncbi:MAG TPA: hypothetical protein VGK32_19875 [Vicinamibacterales bacterium]
MPDEGYGQACVEFSEKELVDLTFAVTAINGWNRRAVLVPDDAGQVSPGSAVRPGRQAAVHDGPVLA